MFIPDSFISFFIPVDTNGTQCSVINKLKGNSQQKNEISILISFPSVCCHTHVALKTILKLEIIQRT